jgi:beta-lactamase regulating signal transducer with metallopeptidase domain
MTSIGWLLFALFLSAKALLVLAAALWLTHLMRDRSAAERHVVWVVASACVLSLPVLSLAGPSWRVAVPSWVSDLDQGTGDVRQVRAPVPAVQIRVEGRVVREHMTQALGTPALVPAAAEVVGGRSAVPAPAVGAEVRAAPAAVVAAEQPHRSMLPLLALLPLLVWVTGSLVVLVRIGAGFAGVRRVARGARPLLDPVLLVRAHGTAAAIGVERPLRFLEGDAAAMPITFGVLRPTLLLPSAARTWTRARQYAVLRHELEHVRRHDSLSQLIAELGCALYWFNPLMWWAARRMCVEREHACDDAVLSSGSRASDYAAELLEIARTLKPQRATAVAAIAMARTPHLRVRVSSLLDARRRRERPSTKLLIPAWIGAFLLILPLSSLAPAIGTGSGAVPTVQPEGAALVVRASSPPPAATVVPPGQNPADRSAAHAFLESGQEDGRQDCLVTGRNTKVRSNTNHGRRTIEWSGSGCSGEVVVEGDIEFDAAFTTITAVSRGGRVRVTTTGNGIERRVTITPASGGVAYDYRVGGARREFDTAGRDWLTSTLLFMFRRVGFMADERAAAISQRGGVNALLSEVDLLNGDHVRARYLAALIDNGGLDEASLERVLGIAGSTIDSDYYRTQIITAVAGRYDFTDGVRDAYIRAVAGIESDYHVHVAFSALLKNGQLTPAQVSTVFTEMGRMASDYYRAGLLHEMAAGYRSSPGMRAAYLDAATALKSDYHKANVLTDLFAIGGMSSADLSRVVDAASTIGSDHYRASVLGPIAEGGLSDAALRRAFVRAAAGIDSDYSLQSVLAALANRGSLEEPELRVLLEAAEGIESDHYRSELLIRIARRHRLDGEARTRFERLLGEIDSRTRRDQVVAALRAGSS